jgi:hypothetical protein
MKRSDDAGRNIIVQFGYNTTKDSHIAGAESTPPLEHSDDRTAKRHG